MTNDEYRCSRDTQNPVDLSNSKEEWMKIKKEREENEYYNCIKSETDVRNKL